MKTAFPNHPFGPTGKVALQIGRRVPQDVAIMGFDDLPWAESLDPPLTTVRQPAYDVGRQAMELLLKRIGDPDRPPVTVRLMPQLVVRRSS
jgi:LacI family transcriptional regulator